MCGGRVFLRACIVIEASTNPFVVEARRGKGHLVTACNCLRVFLSRSVAATGGRCMQIRTIQLRTHRGGRGRGGAAFSHELLCLL